MNKLHIASTIFGPACLYWSLVHLKASREGHCPQWNDGIFCLCESDGFIIIYNLLCIPNSDLCTCNSLFCVIVPFTCSLSWNTHEKTCSSWHCLGRFLSFQNTDKGIQQRARRRSNLDEMTILCGLNGVYLPTSSLIWLAIRERGRMQSAYLFSHWDRVWPARTSDACGLQRQWTA